MINDSHNSIHSHWKYTLEMMDAYNINVKQSNAEVQQNTFIYILIHSRIICICAATFILA